MILQIHKCNFYFW